MSRGTAKTMPGSTAPRNGLPERAGYAYRGSGRDELTPEHVMAAWRRRDPEAAAERSRRPRIQAADRVLDALAFLGGEASSLEVRLRTAADGAGPGLTQEQALQALHRLAGRGLLTSDGYRERRRWRIAPGTAGGGAP